MVKSSIIFGDSIAKGHKDNVKNGWVNRLKLEFPGIEISNFSISGDTTEEVLERFDDNVGDKKADIIVFAIGINDAVYIPKEKSNRVDLDEFEENINIIIEKSKQLTNKIVFIGLTSVDENLTRPIPWRTEFHYINKEIIKYNEAIKRICQKQNIYFADMIGLLKKDGLFDGLHPNEVGHEKMHGRIKDFLIDKNLIKKIDEE